MKKLIKSFSITLFANIVHLAVTIFVTLIVPKFVSLETFAQWQLYLFYTSYLWIFSLGWHEGVYLFYGGVNYNSIDKKSIKLQFFFIIICDLIILSFSFFAIKALGIAFEVKVVVFYMLLDSFVEIPREGLLRILQATDRTIDYSKIIILSRLSFLALICIFLFRSNITFEQMIIADIGTKFFGFMLSVLSCKDILFDKTKTTWSNIKIALAEFKLNIMSGSKLVLGGLCAMFIVGIVRFAIQDKWGVVTFSKVSLTLSISNLFSVFITAISLVLFPILKRTEINSLKKIYIVLDDVLETVLLAVLLFYFPVKQMLMIWLPQYSEGLKYMAILFPICVFQTKTSLLYNTYQKSLGLEKWILIVNLGVLFLSLLTTFFSVYVFENLDATVFFIVISMFLRSAFSEISVWSKLGIHRIIKLFEEMLISLIFIAFSWLIGNLLGFMLYVGVYFIFIIYKHKVIIYNIQIIKAFLVKH